MYAIKKSSDLKDHNTAEFKTLTNLTVVRELRTKRHCWP